MQQVDEGGLVDQWNAVHSSKGRSITPGVEIRAINGSWNPLQMSEEPGLIFSPYSDIQVPSSSFNFVNMISTAYILILI